MLLLAGLISLCVAVSHRLPVKPAPKRILVLNGSLLMVAIVALPPAVAVLAAVLGVAAGNAYLRRPWFNLLFNIGKEGLAVLAAGLLYHALAPATLTTGNRLPFTLPATVPAPLPLY